jgi:hypothetical protein
MRTVTLRVPGDWRGMVDSWAVQAMLKDFSRRHVLPSLVVDPQPGHARLSLSLPEFSTQGMTESVFLRRLIASYLPALKSFRSSRRIVPLTKFNSPEREIGNEATRQGALPPHRQSSMQNARCGATSGRPAGSSIRQIPWHSNREASRDALTSVVPRRSRDLFLTLIVVSIAAILIAAFFIRGGGVKLSTAPSGAAMPDYKLWIPKAL